MRNHSYRPALALAILLSALVLSGRPVTAAKWKPVDAAELAQTSPVIDKNADAEILEWDTRLYDRLDDSSDTAHYENYLRIKIFTERGRDEQSKVELTYDDRTTIEEVEARTIKKNGTIVELKKSDIFKRDVVKANGKKVKAVTFALPDVEVGSVIEYRWNEIEHDAVVTDVPLMFQRSLPIRLVTKHVKPLGNIPYTMHAQPFNTSMAQPKKEELGFYLLQATNIPAYADEPDSPPDFQARPWVLIYYEPNSAATDADGYWKEYSRDVFDAHKKPMKMTPQIRDAAVQATKDASTVQQRLNAIVTYCRKEIRRTDVDTGVAKKAKEKENDNTSDTFSRKAGTAYDLVDLVTVMAQAVGLDARVTCVPSRAEIFHSKRYTQRYFMRHRIVAAKDGADWRFVDPENTYEPNGRLWWGYEQQLAIITDEKDLVMATTPMAPESYSMKRSAIIGKLAEDGTLEADVTIDYTGHFASDYKDAEDSDTPADRQKAVVNQMSKQWPGAEITAVRVDNVTDPFKPYTIAYHVKFPSFAQRAGSRLLIQPALLERGRQPEFTGDTRKNMIYFSYPWSASETVTLELPPGFSLEEPDKPQETKFGDVGGCRMAVSRDEVGRVVFKRDFFMGGLQRIIFNQSSYAAIKDFFGTVAKNDSFAVSAKKATTIN